MILKFQDIFFFILLDLFIFAIFMLTPQLLRSEIGWSLLRLLLILFSNNSCGRFRDLSCFVMFCFALLFLYKKLENGYENPRSLCTLWKGGSSQSSIQLFYRHHLPIYFGLFYAVFDTYHLTLFSSREHYDILPILKIAWCNLVCYQDCIICPE